MPRAILPRRSWRNFFRKSRKCTEEELLAYRFHQLKLSQMESPEHQYELTTTPPDTSFIFAGLNRAERRAAAKVMLSREERKAGNW